MTYTHTSEPTDAPPPEAVVDGPDPALVVRALLELKERRDAQREQEEPPAQLALQVEMRRQRQ